MSKDRRDPNEDRVDEIAALYDQFNASIIPFFHQLGNLMRRASQSSGRKEPAGEYGGVNDSLLPVPEEDVDQVTRLRDSFRNLPDRPFIDSTPQTNLPDLGEYDTGGSPQFQNLDALGQFHAAPGRVPVPQFETDLAENDRLSAEWLDGQIPEYIVRHRSLPQNPEIPTPPEVKPPDFGEVYVVTPSAATRPDTVAVPAQARTAPPPIEEPEELEPIQPAARVLRPSDVATGDQDEPQPIQVPEESFPTSVSLPRSTSIGVPRDVEAAGEDLSEYLIDAVQRLAEIRDAILRVLSMQNAILEQDHAKLIQLESALVRLRC